MADWRVKGLIQAVLGAVPGGIWVNDQLQLKVGDLKRFDQNLAAKVADWCGMVTHLQAVNRHDLRGKSVMEIGSGWYPGFPLMFCLIGVGRLITVDLSRHLSPELTLRLVARLKIHLPDIAAAAKQDLAEVEQRYARLAAARDFDELAAIANLEYLAPQDASRMTMLANDSLDMVYSNDVLEHVSPEVMPAIMRESYRLVRNGGIIVHGVACNDHYAHFDKSISFINYLQFSQADWKLWSNDINYQNRLRASDFVRIATDAGFKLIFDNRAVRPGCREALATIKVDSAFSRYTAEDLVTTTIDFIAEKQHPEA